MTECSSLSTRKLLFSSALSIALLAAIPSFQTDPAQAAMMGGARFAKSKSKSYRTPTRKQTPLARSGRKKASRAERIAMSRKGSRGSKASRRGHKIARAPRHVAPRAIPPQLYLEKLNQLTLKPGVVHKFCNGALNVNVVEVDMDRADVKVRPFLASDTFDSLKTVEQHARESGALVAVNANYFKKDGTPLGTIKVDGEWVSGSLFNRVAMGITRGNDLKFARVDMHGILETSNPSVPLLWVNNMNQPRRSGARLILYTRRWGNDVRLPYEGCLVAVSNRGEVLDTDTRNMTIPYGGYVLSDRKDSALAHLKRGDFVDVDWQTNPKNWNNVEHAISGGPTLIKDGNLFVGLKDEKFRGNWTSAKITRRTACGVTRDNKLLLATVEGPHTLWDLAKFMHQLGCVEAMNLDGGGSTTMVVNGKTVTRNDYSGQRKVAATICVMEPGVAMRHMRNPDARYRPNTNLTEFSIGTDYLSQVPLMNGLIQARIQQKQLGELTFASNAGGFFGNDQALAPPNALNAQGLICEVAEEDQVIDIDNDLVRADSQIPKQAKEPKPLHRLHKELPVPEELKPPKVELVQPPAKKIVAQPVNDKKTAELDKKLAKNVIHDKSDNGWTNKILRPFGFRFGKNRS